MPEPYKSNFLELYKKKKQENYNFFTEKDAQVEGKNYKYLECNIDYDLLKCAMQLAKEKSKFTMKQNQASIPRDDVTKLEKCCQGILAEMFIHILLSERYGFEVYRYDLERKNFIYSTEEYDLKIYVSNEYYEIESRSSNIHYTSVENFIAKDIIIGPYGNSIKMEDELADFHFRPVYMPDFKPFVLKGGKYYYSDKMFNGEIKLIITGVATKEDFIKNGYKKTLRQKGTMYKVVDAKIIGDITEMDKKFKTIV